MATNQLYIANWKMYWTCTETLTFVARHYDDFCRLAATITPQTLVLCPTSTALHPLNTMLADTSIALGGQDCATGSSGAYTGQIAAKDLQQIGCQFCIIGHSEGRRYCLQSDSAIATKCNRLIDCDLSPIVCIGETAEEYQSGSALTVLQNQLTPILKFLKDRETLGSGTEVVIAYEPVWAIGTGTTPSLSHLETVFAWLSKITNNTSSQIPWRLLYGGSVTSSHASQLKKITGFGGFLIGGASLDFQEFEKIVKCN
jgi:triosephosphate isomerase